ncbi:MAG: hypothetical protein ISR61_04370 [Desulfobacteraceae bacterium]|nr:hypothetical protein [Desulfobacteraceae bacterium]MBL7217398.1 hypothetical protein [Desulfobacteraceae bacterium]
MTTEQAILEVLRTVGVYQEAREQVNSDQELTRLFDRDFSELVRLVSKSKALGQASQRA